VAFVWRENGTGLWIANNGSGWQLVWASDPAFYDSSTANSYLYFYEGTAASVMRSDFARMADLEAPFVTSFGAATNYTASPASGATSTHEADFVGYFNYTSTAAETPVWNFRKSDANNYYQLAWDQVAGTIKLFRVVAGTPTELQAGKTQTWTAGTVYRICIQARAGNLHILVNQTQKFAVTGETHNLTATGTDISGFATGASWELWPATLSGAAEAQLNRFFV
jgi:hypothetical protein